MRLAQRTVPLLLAIAAFMFVRAPYRIDAAPYESTMGLVQRIFYFHVPAAIAAMLSAMIAGAASGVFLWRRGRTADAVALAAAELAVVFGLIVLVTGPLWARKAWGIWWTFEARLMSMLLMWMIFVAYLLLRRFGGLGSEVLAAAVGLFGGVLVPFVYWSVNVWRTMHPTTNVVPSLRPEMMRPFIWCVVAFLVLYVALLLVRIRLELSRGALEDAYLAMDEVD
jgi:heme exporter protein C